VKRGATAARGRDLLRAPERAVELRLAPELRQQELRAYDSERRHPLAHHLEERIARLAGSAAEDDGFGIEQRRDGHDGTAQVLDDVACDGTQGAHSWGFLERLGGAHLLAGSFLRPLLDRFLPHDVGEPRLLVSLVRGKRHVARLTCGEMSAAV